MPGWWQMGKTSQRPEIFPRPGYSPRLQEPTAQAFLMPFAASDTWENESKLADLFINRTGFVYGRDDWGLAERETLRQNLAEVSAAVHSDSSNLIGIIDMTTSSSILVAGAGCEKRLRERPGPLYRQSPGLQDLAHRDFGQLPETGAQRSLFQSQVDQRDARARLCRCQGDG